MATKTLSDVKTVSVFAVPFLGLLGAVQGSAPNIASTALVSASRGLSMGPGIVALAASAQTLAIAASVITTGLMADRLGRREVLMGALLLSSLGGIIVAIAPVTAFYLLGQVLIGVGLGAVYGAAFAYIRDVAGKGKVASAVGLFSASLGLATTLITFFGGVLVGIDWRIAYLLTPAISIICFFLVPVLLPKMPRLSSSHLDIFGQVLLAVGIIGLLYGVSQLGHSLTSPKTLVPMLGGALVLAGFFLFESKNKGAFYPVRLFRSPIFIAAILAGFVYNFGSSVAFLQVTNLWQYVTGLRGSEVALWQLPLAAAGIVGALLFGRLITKGMTNGLALLIAAVITGAGFVLLALAHNATSFVMFLPGLVITGMGITAASIPFGNLFISQAPHAQFGPVTSSRTSIGQVFYTVGFAISTVAIDKMTMGGVVDRLTNAGIAPDQIGVAVSSVNTFSQTSVLPTTALARESIADAMLSYGSGFSTMMLITAALCLGAGVIGWLLLVRAGEGRTSAPAAAPSAAPVPQ